MLAVNRSVPNITQYSASTICPSCRSDQIEFDSAQGNAVCQNCGTVVEENAVVAEVTFAELSNGASVLQGQFISAETGVAPAPSIFGRRLDSGQSRAVTIAHGRRRIQAVAIAVGMGSEHYIDAAQRWFVLALQHQFTRGRRAPNIVAACLYIVCRQERTPHMLLDFADVLQTSVYALGGTFLRLVRLLNLEMPLIDPSFYVGRFAARLDFGEKTQLVSNTALRVVARMKRDWIQTGRRPAGVCAAGLIIAARMHGFRRTEREVVQVVRICEATLKKRLEEFGDTPSSRLTPEEFEGVWLEQEHDPPAFLRTASSTIQQQYQKPVESNSVLYNNEIFPTPPASLSPSIISYVFDGNASKSTFSDLDDDEEVNGVLLDNSEISIKTKIWTTLNQDYLVKEAEKEKARALAEGANKEEAHGTEKGIAEREADQNQRNGKGQPGEVGEGNEEKEAIMGRKRKTRSSAKQITNDETGEKIVPETPAQAAKQMLATKKFSKKINYAALDELFSIDATKMTK